MAIRETGSASAQPAGPVRRLSARPASVLWLAAGAIAGLAATGAGRFGVRLGLVTTLAAVVGVRGIRTP